MDGRLRYSNGKDDMEVEAAGCRDFQEMIYVLEGLIDLANRKK